jgi:iron(III) transport system permease protein
VVDLATEQRFSEAPAPSQAVTRSSHRTPRSILIASLCIVAVLAAPLVFLFIESAGAGSSDVAHLMWRHLTLSLLWNTVRLTVVVTFVCALIGTACAFLIERTNLPGRSIWAVLLVVPLAIPDFVVSFSWSSLSGAVSGFQGAVLVMSLAVYPLVYLPVAASLRGADPGQEEIARSLGASRVAVFFRVTLGQARVAILGGSLLVALVILAEYGAFEILGYQTFTTEIFTEFSNFDIPSACALSIVLVVLSIFVLGGEGAARGRATPHRIGSGTARVLERRPLGRAKLPALFGLALLVAAALGEPVGASIYWMTQPSGSPVQGVSIASAALHTAMYGGAAAALSALMALPVAIYAVRHASRVSMLAERSTFFVLAMPGLVIALSISYFSERYANGLFYQSAPLLVLAYAVLFFPLALIGVRASVAQAPVSLEEVASSLGVSRAMVLWRVTIPLVAPGLAAAFSLVFLSTVTELTATLLLIPTGVQTLSTQFWSYEQNLSYSQAAPFALLMIAIAALPSYVLGRYFDRLPRRAAA